MGFVEIRNSVIRIFNRIFKRHEIYEKNLPTLNDKRQPLQRHDLNLVTLIWVSVNLFRPTCEPKLFNI